MQSFGRQFTVLASVDSTNNYAMQQVHARLAKHGDAWLALEQTKGKGQRNKHWVTKAGENITMSIVAEPFFLPPTNSFMLVATVALAIFDFFKHFAGDKTAIKWPNDIYWGDRKAVGILIENVIRDKKWLYAIIGTGININQEEFGNHNATSLFIATGVKNDVIALAKQLCVFLEKRYEQLKNGDYASILSGYNNSMYKLGKTVRFKKDNIIFDALIKGVTADGLLIVDSGKEELFAWGSVEWMTAAHVNGENENR
ncbi:MAG: biotin--[acetyl-CoA-carboxylase] ligase [Agriterribacter sp.]